MFKTYILLVKKLLWVICLLFITKVGALEKNTLYEVEVPVNNAAGEKLDQNQLIQQAFQEALIRISGSRKILDQDSVIKALKDPDKYIKQFSYHQPSIREHTFKVVLNPTLTDQLLAGSGLHPIKQERPLVLAWLVMNGNQSYWVNGGKEEALIVSMEKIFNQRAIPLIFPLLDLEDLSQITEQDLIQKNLDKIKIASRRYHSQTNLVGIFKHENNEWKGHWILLGNEGTANKE